MSSYALISVSDKTGLAPFARGLADLGYQLLSTGGTAKSLEADGLSVTQVSEVTGFPEMLDGRVKTLHPRVHGGILARRDKPEHLASLAEHGIPLIDLVVVNLYPFAKAAADPATTVPGLIEQIDIGGPGMVRAAAKNFRDVLVLVDPADYPRVLEALAGGAAAVPQSLRFELARKAFAHTGAYDQMIASELAQVTMADDRGARIPIAERELFPEVITATHSRIRGSAIRGEPAPAGGLVRGRSDRLRQRHHPPGQGAELHQSPRPRRRRSHRPRVHRTCRQRDQAHEPVRCGDGC